MANRIYDFLPAHLKNNELSTMFESTIDRAFSKGSVEKVRTYVGRKEKGVFKETDSYLNYPTYSYSKKNYAFEPVFSNEANQDYVFYDDLINSLYNKGSLTNDHRRLFSNDYETINLPIDADKFVNWSLYYWVRPGFNETVNGSWFKSYYTIDRGANNWWSNNNSWYHYDDIRELITPLNKHLVEQAKRPIIEFDRKLELTDASLNKDNNLVLPPKFNIYDDAGQYKFDGYIFHYVVGTSLDYSYDSELQAYPRMKAGDYASEFIFNIDVAETNRYKMYEYFSKIYVPCTFDFRNFRQEFDAHDLQRLDLVQPPKDSGAVDVYVNGIRLQSGYSVNNNYVSLVNPVTGYVYVDYCTASPVTVDGADTFQRINPSLEYNVDNNSHINVELSYSVVYEHLLRVIETTIGLTGEAIGVNNFRFLGMNSEKTRFNEKGSVLIKSGVDIKKAYFAITRDDYDPFKAVEFIAASYSNYKSKLVLNIRGLLNEEGSDSKSNSEILEQAMSEISRIRNSVIKIFEGSDMLLYGTRLINYEELDISVVPGAVEQFVPNFENPVILDTDLLVYLNGTLQVLNVDYVVSNTGGEIIFVNYIPVAGDTITVRNYVNSNELYIPPSAAKLGISPAYAPRLQTDYNYSTPITMIVGHDGSKTPCWNDRTDGILLEFEKRVFNRMSNKENTLIDSMNHVSFGGATDQYADSEKNYIAYPFFKKWMIKNSVSDLTNTEFDSNDWKTWNYRVISDVVPGNWRGLMQYFYGTDNPLTEPWKLLKKSRKPATFDTLYGADYSSVSFWTALLAGSGIDSPIPVNENGELRTVEELFFGGSITTDDIVIMNQAWEFGDGSPVELAWKRSSEYPFIAFIQMMLQSPFDIMDKYSDQISAVIKLYAAREGWNVDQIEQDRNRYEFKLGSKLAGFVNNFRLFSENNNFSSSRFTEIPTDNYDVFVHTGEPNRSEFFSAIVLEKVAIDSEYPKYSLADTTTYVKGDIVLNTGDKKYYKRKSDSQTEREASETINFDYSAWTLISQPKAKKIGYRVNGYDEFNPVFFTLDWDSGSNAKTFSTSGDRLTVKPWQSGEFYKLDSFVQYNGTPYVCLRAHTTTSRFDDNIQDWKPLAEWPRTNVIYANGYSEVTLDRVRTYNYGEILQSLDDVAQLMIGYQEYLKAMGWNFSDIDNNGGTVDFESLLYKFLDWSAENHDIGEFITLSPMLVSGSFNAPYGVASVTKETHKNFYRVIDGSGKMIPDTAIKFYVENGVVSWQSQVPIYGMKIDITDIEHAFVVDRVDSYGDVIYDPLANNRNLRMIIDCNRTTDWDGTLNADGYFVYQNALVPNFETLVDEVRYYRDTLVDQSLTITNNLKASMLGFVSRSYMSNHVAERETELEFYKGFLAHKGTAVSINRLVNQNSNIQNITQSPVWAFKMETFGNRGTTQTVTTSVPIKSFKNDPQTVSFNNGLLSMPTTFDPYKAVIKTTGYVDFNMINYVVTNSNALDYLEARKIIEGDIAWIQFDPEREWDVRRLSEIAEIDYVGETPDGQLYLALTNKVDTTDTVYLRIKSDFIDPEISGYFYLVEDGSELIGGIVIYKYLVFETSYEPLIVEIDSSTSNSVYVPTPSSARIEAIGAVSNPTFVLGDVLIINGITYTYVPTAGYTSNIAITSAIDPYMSQGDTIKIAVYNANGSSANTNSVVVFDGTSVSSFGAVSSLTADQITINGVALALQPSSQQNIRLVSTATQTTNVQTGRILTINNQTVTVNSLSVVGSVANPLITATKTLRVNGNDIVFSVNAGEAGMTIDTIIQLINASPAGLVATQNELQQLVLSFDGAVIEMAGSVLIDLGISSTSIYSDSKFERLADSISLLTGVSSYVSTDRKLVIESTLETLIISGNALSTLGINSGTYTSEISPTVNSVVDQINALSIPNVSARTTSNGFTIRTNGSSLTLKDVTTGALGRLGFAYTSGNNTVLASAITTIVDEINRQAFADDSSIAVATLQSDGRSFTITSTKKSIVISNVSGSALTTMGISTGTYIGSAVSNSSVYEFRDQINAVESDVEVSVSTDGRMIFSSNATLLSFANTSTAMRSKIGIYLEYTSATSNVNFQIMRWKSVRYTPGYNGDTFSEFYTSVGLNANSFIWADSYQDAGWAVLEYIVTLGLRVIAKQAPRVDTSRINRLIVKDGADNFSHYQIFDPLNGIFPGEIGKALSYITWSDPAKYAASSDLDVWNDDQVGKIWWDTTNARYYRYHDYGDALGNIIESYARQYWGKLVPGSTVDIRIWTVTEYLPKYITEYNTYTYFDVTRSKTVTKYYYWENTITDPNSEEVTASDVKAMIEANSFDKMFYPIDSGTIIVSNNKSRFIGSAPLEFTLEYDLQDNPLSLHSEWLLVNENVQDAVPDKLYKRLIQSLSGIENVDAEFVMVVNSEHVSDTSMCQIFGIPFLPSCDFTNSLVTVNSNVIPTNELRYDGTTLRILSSNDIIVGDVVRVYKVSLTANPWFTKISEARSNFQSIVNEYLNYKMIDAFAPSWRRFVSSDNMIIDMVDWVLSEKFRDWNTYAYLSKTKTFDMNALYETGVQTFKVSTDNDEFYAVVDGELRLVKKTNSSLRVNFVDVATPENFNIRYYENAIGIQVMELFELLSLHAEPSFMKKIFVEMVKYLFTEKQHRSDVFKTSYFDLSMIHNTMKQHAIYQRDSYNDMIDYINETKPYHAKIREVGMFYQLDEQLSTSVDASYNTTVVLQFGEPQKINILVDADFIRNPVLENVFKSFYSPAVREQISVYLNGKLLRPAQYGYDNNTLTFSPAYDGSANAEAIIFYAGDKLQIQRRISRLDNRRVDGNIAVDGLDVSGSYDGGSMLRLHDQYTSEKLGIDTGFVPAQINDSMFVRMIDRETGILSSIDVYDQFGRGNRYTVDLSSTVAFFADNTIIVDDETGFPDSNVDDQTLIAVDNGSNVEFMLYDGISDGALNVSRRGVFNGVQHTFAPGDKVYLFRVPKEIYSINVSNTLYVA